MTLFLLIPPNYSIVGRILDAEIEEILENKPDDKEKINKFNELHRQLWKEYKDKAGIVTSDGTVDILKKCNEIVIEERVPLDEIINNPKIKVGEVNCFIWAKIFAKKVRNKYPDVICYIIVNFAIDKGDFYIPHASIFLEFPNNYHLMYDTLGVFGGIVGRPLEKEDIKGKIQPINSLYEYYVLRDY